LRHEERRDPLAESQKHHAMKLLRQIPSMIPTLLIALIQTAQASDELFCTLRRRP
jgi:hypothetical protein